MQRLVFPAATLLAGSIGRGTGSANLPRCNCYNPAVFRRTTDDEYNEGEYELDISIRSWYVCVKRLIWGKMRILERLTRDPNPQSLEGSTCITKMRWGMTGYLTLTCLRLHSVHPSRDFLCFLLLGAAVPGIEYGIFDRTMVDPITLYDLYADL